MANNHQSAKDAIKAYLDNRAAHDELFAANYAKENKSLDECFQYILGEARQRGTSVCMTDDEVFDLAVHYYDEDNIKIRKTSGASLTRTAPKAAPIELTDEEKARAKEEALKLYQAKCREEEAQREAERKKTRRERKKQEPTQLASLFDFE